jgi:hypothetical protein
MSMMPPFDTGLSQDIVEGGTSQGAGALQYVPAGEATEDDRLSFGDRLAIIGAIILAQLIRLAIIAAAVALIVLVIFLASKV